MAPAYSWTTRPDMRWMVASYAQELSNRDSIKCRTVIASEWYQQRWGHVFHLADDQNQIVKFGNDKQGWRLATSVGGRGTGEHPDIFLFDDPMSIEQAMSDPERTAKNRWISDTAMTRGAVRGVRRIMTMQRAHPDDSTNFVLGLAKWHMLCLPMEYDPDHPHKSTTILGFADPRKNTGELLWPAVWTSERFNRLKEGLPPDVVAAQFQQNPVPPGGGLFKKEWLRYWTDGGDHYVLTNPNGPSRMVFKSDTMIFAVADLANTEKKTADFSVIAVYAVVTTGRPDVILLDVWRERAAAPRVQEMMFSVIARYSPVCVIAEDGTNSKDLLNMWVMQGIPIKKVKPVGDKVARAQQSLVVWQNGRFHVNQSASWFAEWENEHLRFPGKSASIHDDQVDTTSYACQHVCSMYGGYAMAGRSGESLGAFVDIPDGD